MKKYCFVYMTAKDKKEARRIGRALVRDKLAACCNIIPGVNSFYRWEGKIQDDHECVLVAKTPPAVVKKLIKRVKELHSYTCPEIVVLPIIAGNPDYLKWLERETGEA
jgi:periplasmic divalent cation tolerance protein